MGVIFFKGLITLELAGWPEEHKNLEACDKNKNPLGSEIKVDYFLVFTGVLNAAGGECCLCKIQLTFFISVHFQK